jgi:hypothetical protein
MNILLTLVISIITCCIGISIGIAIANDRHRRRKKESTELELQNFDQLGEELMRTRRKIGTTIREAAIRADTDYQILSNMEIGRTQFTTFRKALEYTRTLGIDTIIIHLKE